MDKDFGGGGIPVFFCIIIIILCIAVFHGEAKNEEGEIWGLVRSHEVLIVNGKEYPTEDIVDIDVEYIHYSDDVVTFTLDGGTIIKTGVHGYTLEMYGEATTYEEESK